MITSFNINCNSNVILVSESLRDEIKKILSDYSFSRYRIDITLSQSTFKECRDELDNIFGEELLNMVVIIPDNRTEFGMIDIYVTDARTNNRIYSRSDILLFEKISDYNISDLQSKITIESPQFLIMSMGTWQILNMVDDDNVDMYNHEVAYYHSYCKVPVALTEFAKPGEVYIVK